MRPEHGIYRDEREQPSQRKQLRRGTALLIAKLTIWSFHFTVAEARMKRLDCSQNAIITMSANQRNKPSRSSSLSTQCNYQTVSTSLTIWTLGGGKTEDLVTSTSKWSRTAEVTKPLPPHEPQAQSWRPASCSACFCHRCAKGSASYSEKQKTQGPMSLSHISVGSFSKYT